MTFSRADLDRLSHIMAEAAETEIMPRFRSLEDGGIREKTGALDLVTDADEQAEWRMRDACAKAFPHALFVGEESVARDKTLLTKIKDADLAHHRRSRRRHVELRLGHAAVRRDGGRRLARARRWRG